jgi:hypothetical protein
MTTTAESIGSYIILLTFLGATAYLIYDGKEYKGMAMISHLTTAILLCFGGLFFTGIVTALLSALGTTIENKIILSLLVCAGTLLCLLIRQWWRKRRASIK